MKPRKKSSHKKIRHAPRDVSPAPETEPQPMRVDWSEPVDVEGPRYDFERDRVAAEVGPDEADVDQRLEH